MNILCIIDRPGWCWETSARAVAAALPKHRIDIMPAERIRANRVYANYDLIWSRALPWDYPNGHKCGAPWVWTFTSGNHIIQDRYSRYQPHLANAAGIITQNAGAESALRRFAPPKVRIAQITNGVDCDRFRPESMPVEGVVGMAANTTGWRSLLKGLPHVLLAARNAGLATATTGKEARPPYRPATPPERMPEWYNSITYYAQPSTAEGCSNSVWEAMACGRICLICPGVGWHGENCIGDLEDPLADVVWVKQDAWDILEKLERLEADPALRLRISQNARRTAEQWQWPRIAAMFERFFLDVLDRAN